MLGSSCSYEEYLSYLLVGSEVVDDLAVLVEEGVGVQPHETGLETRGLGEGHARGADGLPEGAHGGTTGTERQRKGG
jgi:hypothetical protein